MLAWHFVGKTLRDGKPVPPDGKWLVHKGEVVMCVSGLHASKEPFDALTYAPGNTLCLVECEDIVDECPDKLVCRRRKIVARMDAEEMLRYFARMEALSVVHKWDAPDVVLDFLMTGENSLRASARDAAWYEGWSDAMRRAAMIEGWAGAMRREAREEARAAAAAGEAARREARDAVWGVTRSVGRGAAKQNFNALVYECFEDWLLTYECFEDWS